MSKRNTTRRQSFSSGREPFPRLDGQRGNIVDIDAYAEYLGDPSQVPVEIGGSGNPYVYQHLYWQESFYKQKGVPIFIKDLSLTNFQGSPYNQLGMRREEELKVHQRYEEHISPPDPEFQSMSLADFAHFDQLGAAAVGKRVALVPEAVEYLTPGNGLPKIANEFSPVEKADYFDAQIEKSLEALKSPLITPQRVITGVITRLSTIINSAKLEEESQRRITEDPLYYPMRLSSLSYYYHQSNELLARVGDAEIIPIEEAAQELKAA